MAEAEVTALVTGATGFLGSRLARLLVARGGRVRVLARPTSDRRRIADLPVEIMIGDVTDGASVDAAADGADIVFHCAALYTFGPGDPARMRSINVDGTENVLAAAARRGAIAVHVSSVAALGPTGVHPADETHWSGDAPRSAYEATKREAHEVARRAARCGARVRIAMPGTIYGPDDPSLVGFLHRLAARGWLRVGFRPDVRMSLVHVDDCADALVRVAEAGGDGGEWVIAADVVSFREWFAAIARVTVRPSPRVHVPDALLRVSARVAFAAGIRPDLVRELLAMSDANWAFSGARARRDLGWAPRPLDDGLRETLAFYRHGRRP